MKPLPTALAAHYASGSTSLCDLLKITRTDGLTVAFTSADVDVLLGGITYSAAQGLLISSLEISAGLAVDNLELTTLDDGSIFTQADVLSGRWSNAAFEISRCNYLQPAAGVEVRMVGTIGNVTLKTGSVVAELRGLTQYLQQPIGSLTSATCRARLGDSLCRVPLAGFTVSGSITAASNAQVFTDSTKLQAADFFTEGLLTWTSGANAGLSQKIKTFAAGTYTLARSMWQPVQVGDTYSAQAGCRKRLAEDCAGKFNNVLNFQGEPHLPGTDALTR